MQIVSNSIKQNRNLSCGKKAPSFQARLVSGKGVKKILNTELADFYQGCVPEARANYFGNQPLDCKQVYKNIQKAVKDATKGIGGRIKFEPNNSKTAPGRFLSLSYIKPNGEVQKLNISVFAPHDILPDEFLDNGKVLSSATKSILAEATDIVSKDPQVGYGPKNKFHIAYDKLPS